MRESRRRAILEVAISRFALEGFSQTGMSQVAAQAGVAHGTVFLYFKTKEELFRAAVLEPLDDLERRFIKPLEAEGTPLEKIRRAVREHIGVLSRMESYLRLSQYVIGQRARFGELADALFAFARRLGERLIPIIVAGQKAGELGPGDPYMTYWSYFSYVNGLGLVTLDPLSDEDWETIIENGVRLFGPLRDAKGER